MNKIKEAIDRELGNVTFDMPIEKIEVKRRLISRNTIRTLVIAAVLVALMGTVSLVSVSANKKFTASFAVNTSKHGARVENDAGKTDYFAELESIQDVYIPTIPKGFTVMNDFRNEHFVSIKWENQNGNIIDYSQRILAVEELIELEEDKLCSTDVEGVSYMFFTQNGVNTVLWNDYGYAFSLSADCLTQDELYEISCTLLRENR